MAALAGGLVRGSHGTSVFALLPLGLLSARNILLRRRPHPLGIGGVAHQVGNRETKLRLRAKMRWIKHGGFIRFWGAGEHPLLKRRTRGFLGPIHVNRLPSVRFHTFAGMSQHGGLFTARPAGRICGFDAAGFLDQFFHRSADRQCETGRIRHAADDLHIL
jgi:hypothetical protein